jgi:hypothetical protein
VRRIGFVARFSRPRILALGLLALAGAAQAQTPPQSVSSPSSVVLDYFKNWFERVEKTQAEQPHWITPLVTVTPRLEQEFRYDQIYQNRPHGQTLDSFGGGKGLELIPAEQIEVILGIPAWQVRNHPSGTDGFADLNLLLKYRLLSANEEQGNYILTLFAGFTLPTGSQHNTYDHAIFTPTVAFGKGWGDFDVQATFGASVPDNAVGKLGTPLLANAALQYHVAQIFWPEVEVNYTYWPNGERQGIHQVFITSGLVIGRIPLWKRLAATVGAGFQVAVTKGPVYHNASILSVRFPF